jgi:hypothetical protein
MHEHLPAHAACMLTERWACCAGCEYAAVERVNREHVAPILADLVQQPFFRYFKVALYCDCPFWPDDGMCMLRDCSVCECEDEEVPAPWKRADTGAGAPCDCAHALRTLLPRHSVMLSCCADVSCAAALHANL